MGQTRDCGAASWDGTVKRWDANADKGDCQAADGIGTTYRGKSRKVSGIMPGTIKSARSSSALHKLDRVGGNAAPSYQDGVGFAAISLPLGGS